MTIYEIESLPPQELVGEPIEGQLTWPQLTIYPDLYRETALRVAEDLVFVYDCIALINRKNGLAKAALKPEHFEKLLGRYEDIDAVRQVLRGTNRNKNYVQQQARKAFMDIVLALGIVRPEMTPEHKSASYDVARYILFQQVAGPKNHDTLVKYRSFLTSQIEKLSPIS